MPDGSKDMLLIALQLTMYRTKTFSAEREMRSVFSEEAL